jgi:hypothetical protein
MIILFLLRLLEKDLHQSYIIYSPASGSSVERPYREDPIDLSLQKSWFLNDFIHDANNHSILKKVTTTFSISFDTKSNFLYIVICAGVVKLVDARDSKSRGASTPCRFDSDLRHQ